MNRKLRITAIILLLFNAVGALWGGFGLIYDPSGEFMQMPLEFLDRSPFNNYLIPGIILFVFNGLLCLLTVVFTIIKYKLFPYFIVFQGIVLVVWLSVQILMIHIFYPPMHLPFYFIGVALIAIGSILLRERQTM
jgi:CDP-diglyceride synthetase